MDAEETPFKFLGFQIESARDSHYRFYFLAKAIGYPTMIRSPLLRRHMPRILLTIAPMQFWERYYGTRNGINWKLANEWVKRESLAAGIYVVPTSGPVIYKDLTARNRPR